MPGRNRAIARVFIRGLTGAPTHHCEAALTLRAPPPLLPFPFPPSRLLAPAELCARRLGPLPCHCNPLSVERPDPPLSNRRAGTGHHALWLAGVVSIGVELGPPIGIQKGPL